MHKLYSARVLALGCLILVFGSLFAMNIKSDLPLIFKKDLYAHDESSNSVVAANLTRKFFPPMVRVNPLNPVQGNWMEGPYWQHIPPMFAYVPYVFFKLDGQVTIEVKRLSYALVEGLTGILLILVIWLFTEEWIALVAAFLAAVLWIDTPFTHALVTGLAFGVSDIVLAFCSVAAFGGILWYLKNQRAKRLEYSWIKLVAISFLVALPVMAKNLLGAIPPAMFLGLLIYDHRRSSKQIWIAGLSFLGFLALYYAPLYFASPVTFKKEILVAFFHFSDLEGWQRPWDFYLTSYLPQLYLFKYTAVYFIGLVLSAATLFWANLTRTQKILMRLSLGWFIWNLVVISIVTSKVPNFIYQSYLFSLFAICLAALIWIGKIPWPKFWTKEIGLVVLIFALVFSAWNLDLLYGGLRQQRAQPYDYQSEHEKFYQTAELLRDQGLNTQDLIIVRIGDDDCWFRYYPLFLTGTESKTLLEMYFGYSPERIKAQYRNMYFIVNKNEKISSEFPYQRIELPTYSEIKYNLSDFTAAQIQAIINGYLTAHAADIQADIQRIKKDTTTCQWLVPDSILNAP